MKTILKVLFAVAVVMFMASLPKDNPVVFGSACFIAFALVTALVVPKKYFGAELNAVTAVKVWDRYIIEKLRRINDWLMRSNDEGRYVLGGATVYIPQAGADPTIEVNTSTYPGVAVQRTDNDVNYNLDVYRTVPSHVAWEELQTISYDKLDSVLKGHSNALAEAVGDVILTKWAPTVAGKQIATTGSDIDAAGSSQTGQRKGFDPKNLASAMVALNVANVPKNGRVCIIDDNMYEYFYDQLSQSMMNSFNQFANNATGQVGRLHGFDIYTRSAVLRYATGGATCNAYQAAEVATDNLASLCYQEDMVCRAVGETKLFTDKDNPLYYGDLFSAILRMGERKKRSDNNGVIAIVQGQ